LKKARIALCLSGGGFRAALFHLGVLRRLHETGLLNQVATISSVSGGSIIAAFAADRIVASGGSTFADIKDWENTISKPFRALTSRDFRTGPVMRHTLWNWLTPGPLARAMVKRFRRRLSSLPLSQLPERPRFVFCATDVSFGVNWILSRDSVGDYQAGYAPPPAGMDLGFAVGASACFPPLFGPLKVGLDPSLLKGGAFRGAGRDSIVARLALTDGGVYDNLGLEPALKNHDTVIVSDAGGPFPFHASRTPFIRYMRYPGLVMKQVAALRRRQLMAMIDDNRWRCSLETEMPDCRVRLERDGCLHRDNPSCKDHQRRPVLRRGVYLSIQSDVDGYAVKGREKPVGYERALVKTHIANVRTDLDRFTAAEQQILENHGYTLAEAGMQQHLPDVSPAQGADFVLPHPDMLKTDVALAELSDSHQRFSLKRMLNRR